MSRLDDELTEINEKIVDPAKLKLTAENFLNPLNSLDLQMRAADMLQMDLLARKIFLNLEIDQQKTVLYRYKEPFQTLISGVKTGQITCGEERPDVVARLCMVVDWCIDHPRIHG